MKLQLFPIVRRIIPLSVRRGIYRYTRWPPVGTVHFGSLRRLVPFSRDWGSSRGLPIDRYYIEGFLSAHAEDIRGRVLEIKDDTYMRKFGGERVTRSDVLHRVEGNPKATIVADLTCTEEWPTDNFDCIICTQTLQFIYEVKAAIATLHRILKPDGVLLVTIPSISQISRFDMEHWGDYWRFTTLSARLLFEGVFPAPNVTVQAHGNVLAAIALLQGLASEELRQEELDYADPDYELLITVRAVKPEAGA
jgi:SAM-dependent methyltransferase